MIYTELLWEVSASGFSLQPNCVACFHEHSWDKTMVSSSGNDVKLEKYCTPQSRKTAGAEALYIHGHLPSIHIEGLHTFSRSG